MKSHTKVIDEALRVLESLVPSTKPLRSFEVDRAALRSKTDDAANRWRSAAGAYVFLHADVARYVGRALKGRGLAGRLREHGRAKPLTDIGGVLSHQDLRILVVPLQDESAWLAPSLELFLHWWLRDDGTLVNAKRS